MQYMQKRKGINKNVSLIVFCLPILLGLIILSSCNSHAHRYTTKMINPELIGKWQSLDGCYLDLAKENESLVLITYHDNKGSHLQKTKLNFKTYSIETKLTNAVKSASKFSAKYIDGAIIIESSCNSPLQKIAN